MSDRYLGQRIRVAMAAARVTRTRLAEACGVSRQTVHWWETNKNFPRASNLVTIAQVTGASVEWLMEPGPVDVRTPVINDARRAALGVES